MFFLNDLDYNRIRSRIGVNIAKNLARLLLEKPADRAFQWRMVASTTHSLNSFLFDL